MLIGGVPGPELAVGVLAHGVEAAVVLDEETVVAEIGNGLIARAEQEKDTEQGDGHRRKILRRPVPEGLQG